MNVVQNAVGAWLLIIIENEHSMELPNKMKYCDKSKIIVNILLCILFPIVMSSVSARDISNFRVQDFISDYHHYKIGDVAPDIYFTQEYCIKKWDIRHLPPPLKNAHWSYMYGTYVMLNDINHKIIMAFNSDIFYRPLP